MRQVDLHGQRFGSLTVVRRAGYDSIGSRLWDCECVCGRVVAISTARLRHKHYPTNSCGCMRGINISNAVRDHGMSNTKIFRVWQGMIRRCTSETHDDYPRYGGRGIEVCERWQKFQNFFDDMEYAPPGMTLGRIDNDRGYEPANCRWETQEQQQNNRRSNRVVMVDGKRFTIMQLSRANGIAHDTLIRRIKLGWPMERAISQPVKRQRNNRVLAA